MLSAIVLIKAEPAKVAKLGATIAGIAGVSEVYSVTGDDDLVVLLRSNDADQVARLVTEDISRLDGIVDTHTMIAFRQYSPSDVDF
jgi:DNA-binding Lrp family transcriptional regulator